MAEERPSFEDVDWRLRALNTSGWRGLVASHRQQMTRNVLEVQGEGGDVVEGRTMPCRPRLAMALGPCHVNVMQPGSAA